MPSTYAHYRMGLEVCKHLDGREREIIETWREPYMIGLHGPDILFYYGALYSNKVNAVGYGLHEQSGRRFFETACHAVRESENHDAALSYAYGVLNHFALDMSCHPYVDEKIASSNISHTEIEVEFDRSLMIADGLDPVSHVLTDHIKPTMENARIIAPFYPCITAQQVLKALRGMIFQNRMLLAKTSRKRSFIYAVLKLTGNYEEMHGLIVNPAGNPACQDSNQKLLELYNAAKERAEAFITDFDCCLSGAKPFPPIFDYNFAGKPVQSEEQT